jgi:soluble lytic murein transglycosylase-like protein
MINILITFYSLVNGLDPSLSFKIARIESNMNPNAISKTNDGGIFQLNSRYYRFHNPAWVFLPHTNIALALKTLGTLKNKCPHRVEESFVICYNLGVSGAKKIKRPFANNYYVKVKSMWRL